MESVIKWRTGKPSSQYMLCVVTDVYNNVDIDIWNGEYWLSYHMEEVLAWCPLNEIEPYKEETMEETKIDIPEQYPKTYEECCKILNICPNGDIVYAGNWVYGGDYLEKHLEIIRNFQKLRICRDAYWEIAGKQMGLGKPWGPDWNDESERKYTIVAHDNHHCYANCKGACSFLTFPTAEMRDAFLENFGHLIEICKELL